MAGKITVIGPTREEVMKVLRAFLLIRKTDKREYQYVQSRVKIIFISCMLGFTNEFFMPEKVWFANRSVIRNNDLAWLSSLIVHEAFHATQFKKGMYVLPLGKKLEAPALLVQRKFLRKIEGGKGRGEIESAVKKKYWREMRGDKRSFSYFRNLLHLLENKKLQLTKMGA